MEWKCGTSERGSSLEGPGASPRFLFLIPPLHPRVRPRAAGRRRMSSPVHFYVATDLNLRGTNCWVPRSSATARPQTPAHPRRSLSPYHIPRTKLVQRRLVRRYLPPTLILLTTRIRNYGKGNSTRLSMFIPQTTHSQRAIRFRGPIDSVLPRSAQLDPQRAIQ